MIWLVMVALALSITRLRALATPRGGTMLIVGGGVVFPVLVLTSLLLFGVSELPQILAAAPDERLRIEVTGNQWWWRVRYVTSDGRTPVETANEVRLPVGQRVNAYLRSADVVHSFWIPALAGKMVLDELSAVNDILNAKATAEEADAFRRWLLEVAQAAANAAKEGGFMGFHAVRVSEGEEKMLQQMRETLGATENA